jgi:hypothetical protein
MNGNDLVWVRSLSGYRLGVILPKGIRVHVVERRRTTGHDQRRTIEARVCQPERPGESRHDSCAKDQRAFTPQPFMDVFFDDVKTLYDLDQPDTGKVNVSRPIRITDRAPWRCSTRRRICG